MHKAALLTLPNCIVAARKKLHADNHFEQRRRVQKELLIYIQKKKKANKIFYGGASPTNCSDPLFSRQSCHFKKWSNIINGGHQGLTFCSNSPVPRPSHHYGGPGSIKIQSLLWLVWLRRASAQRRSSDPLLALPECPLRPVLGSGLRQTLNKLQRNRWTL